MNGFKLLLLIIQAFEVFSSSKLFEFKFPHPCGQTATIPEIQTKGKGNIIPPHKYSWLASLEYGNLNTFGHCAGSVINSRYVLTAAQCVTGERIQKLGGLTGVRLGNFTQWPYCDYGTSNCNSYLHFGIADIKVHEHYGRDSKQTLGNDIALLRLDRSIPLGDKLMPVCLPLSKRQLSVNTPLTVSGWGLKMNSYEPTAKRAINVTLLRTNDCKFPANRKLCAGLLSSRNINGARTANTRCQGDSGGPLMEALNTGKMTIVGIASFSKGGNCIGKYFPTHYTHVSSYIRWIKKNMHMGRDYAKSKESKKSTVEFHFPSDCGYSPIYPRELSNGGYIIPPDEFSWLASLVYANNKTAFGHCSGSVIHSRYILTSGSCVTNGHQRNLGNLIGVRLGDFSNDTPCDYGTESCQHYQFFGIDRIKVHEKFMRNPQLMNDIALLKLNRDIVFGTQMKPICLPFGITVIPAPLDDAILNVSGWWTTMFPTDIIAKRNTAVAFWNTTACMKAKPDKDTQLCGVKPGKGPCTVELGSPLMNMFKARNMVLEGVAYSKTDDCPGTDVATLYTRVRSYEKWITNSIKALEVRQK